MELVTVGLRKHKFIRVYLSSVSQLMNMKRILKFKFGLFNGYSYRLDLFRVKTRVSSYNLYTIVFNKKEPKLCVQRKRERDGLREEKTERFF